MKTSSTIDKLAASLTKAQGEIKNATKSATNPHFKNRYVPLDEMIPVCKEALNANGIAFVQGAEQSESGDVLHLSTMLLHTSGQYIESTLTMRPVKADPQGIGSCITYARRYALAAICGVASDDDDDANAASHAPAPAKPAKPAKSETTVSPDSDRRSQYARITIQKGRPVAKTLSEQQWDGLICDCFDIPAKELINELSPIALNAGIEKLISELDAMEAKSAA